MFNPREAFFLQWHITDRCNFRCTHCYRDSVKAELSAGELGAVFENFRRLRREMPQTKARVQIAGGEPLLSEHLFHVLDLVAEAGFQSRILTNGSLADAAMAREIAEHGCRIVQISLDGASATHDSMRGPGSFERAMEGARRLCEAGIQVTFSMTLTRDNRSEIGAVFEAARGLARRVSVHRLVPCGRGANLRDQLLSKGQLEEAFEEVIRQRERCGDLEVPLRDPLWKPFLRHLCFEPYVDGCSIGYGGICIDSNADVYPCRRMPVVVGNALSDELTDIWYSAPMSRMRDRNALRGRCGRCALRWRCGGCRAIAWALTGDPLQEDAQCFSRLSFGEKLAFRMVDWWNRKAHAGSFGGGG
jgi:radical SAM protein with 4Fe4S-binding SPASM domain